MDFVHYAERAAQIVNQEITDERDLKAFLTDRPWLRERVAARDVGAVRQIQRRLRDLFDLAHAGKDKDVVAGLNELLVAHPVSPFISGHDKQSWHLHVAERESSVASNLAAEAVMGMAVVVCDLGADRFGVCAATPCTNTFVDTSPNRSRRYCSDRCSSRANVAAYRQRLRSGR